MANHKSAAKRHLQSEKKRIRNRSIKSVLAGKVKKARAAISNKTATPKSDEIRAVQKELAIAARKGVINKKAASRRTSRLMKQANQLKSA